MTFLDRPYKYLKTVSAVLDVSMTQVVNDILEYISKEVDESKIWENWDDLYDEFQETLAGLEEEEDKDEEDEGEEEEEEDQLEKV